MKVVQIVNYFQTGGAEKLIVDSVPLLLDKGVDVDVVTLRDVDTPFKKILESKIGVKINGLSVGSIYNPFLIFRLIPVLRTYDVVHIHLFPSLYWVVIAKIISGSKVKLVYTEHNTHNRRRNSLFFKVVDRFIYKQLDVITAITNGVKIELQNHLKYNTNIRVINNGIDTKAFKKDIKKVYNFFSEDDFKLIQVSSFREQKDQATIIRSLKLVPENVKLILVGDGYLIENNKKLVADLGLSNRVMFLGNRYDIPELMNYADVAILSSHWEGFGLAIIEGMAAGKPSIASNVDGIREIVKGYGLLFEQGNEKELSKHIYDLLNDRDYYKKVASKCFKRAQEFDIDRMVESYIELYKEILNE